MFAWRALPARSDATPGAILTVPALSSAGIRVGFTGRAGGVSVVPHDTLNLSLVAPDDQAAVLANRARALGALGVELDAWTSGQQVHGVTVARVTASERGRGARDAADTIRDTDALWTDEPGVALVVLTADCVPLALVDPVRRRVGVVHAGWRGLVGGIVGRAVEAFGDPASVLAFWGPSIGPCCYQVRDDVAEPARVALGDGVVRRSGDAQYLDLWRGIRGALHRAGVPAVYGSALCTRCEPHRFFSHRAGHAARQGVVVVLDRG